MIVPVGEDSNQGNGTMIIPVGEDTGQGVGRTLHRGFTQESYYSGVCCEKSADTKQPKYSGEQAIAGSKQFYGFRVREVSSGSSKHSRNEKALCFTIRPLSGYISWLIILRSPVA